MSKNKEIESVVVRFAGDSGDGIQLMGSQFAVSTALAGADFATFPDFPAEIRAPRGTRAGVSGFQVQFSSTDIFTPGDRLDALVAMTLKVGQVNLTVMGMLDEANTGAYGHPVGATGTRIVLTLLNELNRRGGERRDNGR